MGATANNERITTLRQTIAKAIGVQYFTGQIFSLDPTVDKTTFFWLVLRLPNLCETSTQMINKIKLKRAKENPKFSHGGPIQRQV